MWAAGWETHPANRRAAPTAAADQVPRTLARLPGVFHSCHVLHEEPIAGAGPVAQGIVRLNRHVVVAAAQGGFQEGWAVLQQAGANLATGPGQVVERVEVDITRDGVNDTDVRSVFSECKGGPSSREETGSPPKA
jgi:hypothetical protein